MLGTARLRAAAAPAVPRHAVPRAGDQQQLLALSSSLLLGRQAVLQEVSDLREALKDAQQGFLRLSGEHSDVLREHLQVLGDLQKLQQQRDALQQERALLQAQQASLRRDNEALHLEHEALLTKHAALLQEHAALRQAHEALHTDAAGLAKDQQALQATHASLQGSCRAVRHRLHGTRLRHASLRQDHLRLLAERDGLLQDVDSAVEMNQRVISAVEETWQSWLEERRARKRYDAALLSRAAEEKERALTQALEGYGMLLEERNRLRNGLAQLKTEYESVLKEKDTWMKDAAAMAETNQQVVSAVQGMRHEWLQAEEARRRHTEYLLARATQEKERAEQQALVRYNILMSERNELQEEVTALHLQHRDLQEDVISLLQDVDDIAATSQQLGAAVKDIWKDVAADNTNTHSLQQHQQQSESLLSTSESGSMKRTASHWHQVVLAVRGSLHGKERSEL